MVTLLCPARHTPSVAAVPLVLRQVAPVLRRLGDFSTMAEIVLLELGRFSYDTRPPRRITTTPWRLVLEDERLRDFSGDDLAGPFDELLEAGLLFGLEHGYQFRPKTAELMARLWLEAGR